jgi:dimethylhistidine N-methyltransferase
MIPPAGAIRCRDVPPASPDACEYERRRADVLAALRSRRRPRRLPSRYLYDARGALLFERICELDEYYLTRTERGILRDALPEIADRLGPRVLVFEPGSGAGEKTRLLLSALDAPAGYVPIDVSREQLFAQASALARDFPGLEVCPLWADFLGDFRLPAIAGPVRRRVAFFPGSTLGNLTPREAIRLLDRLRTRSGRGGAILIGLDMQKDPRILEPAYDDAAGVSAAFALNYLVRLNRELHADFDLDRFGYEARYEAIPGRIVMALVSRVAQRVTIAGEQFDFAAGERLITEYSYKYTREGFAALARHAGLAIERIWTDPRGYFTVQLLTAA